MKSIGYSRGGSGNIAAHVMEKLGIADELKARTQFIDGRPVAEDVAKGLVEIGLQQINVILPVEGIDYVGPLPPDLQDTVKFTGAVLTSSRQPEAAKAFLAFIASPEAASPIRQCDGAEWQTASKSDPHPEEPAKAGVSKDGHSPQHVDRPSFETRPSCTAPQDEVQQR